MISNRVFDTWIQQFSNKSNSLMKKDILSCIVLRKLKMVHATWYVSRVASNYNHCLAKTFYFIVFFIVPVTIISKCCLSKLLLYSKIKSCCNRSIWTLHLPPKGASQNRCLLLNFVLDTVFYRVFWRLNKVGSSCLQPAFSSPSFPMSTEFESEFSCALLGLARSIMSQENQG